MTPPAGARGAGPFWRVFPWDPMAADGVPFSPAYVRPVGTQTAGRFDPGHAPVLYLAESPEHALSEILRRYQGKPLRAGHLRVAGTERPGVFYSRALVRVWIPPEVDRALPDLADGATLQCLGIRADALASEDRSITQQIARDIHAAGLPGFRWWSALRGDWHATVLFLDRVDPQAIRYDTPEPLSTHHPLVRRVAELLNMSVAGR